MNNCSYVNIIRCRYVVETYWNNDNVLLVFLGGKKTVERFCCELCKLGFGGSGRLKVCIFNKELLWIYDGLG